MCRAMSRPISAADSQVASMLGYKVCARGMMPLYKWCMRIEQWWHCTICVCTVRSQLKDGWFAAIVPSGA